MRPIFEIANEISKEWRPVHYTARPYLNAMKQMNEISDQYGNETGQAIILYFLGSAGTWRGESARRIKAELRGMLPKY